MTSTILVDHFALHSYTSFIQGAIFIINRKNCRPCGLRWLTYSTAYSAHSRRWSLMRISFVTWNKPSGERSQNRDTQDGLLTWCNHTDSCSVYMCILPFPCCTFIDWDQINVLFGLHHVLRQLQHRQIVVVNVLVSIMLDLIFNEGTFHHYWTAAKCATVYETLL